MTTEVIARNFKVSLNFHMNVFSYGNYIWELKKPINHLVKYNHLKSPKISPHILLYKDIL